MNKRERLNSKLEKQIVGYIWTSNEVWVKTEKLSELFKAGIFETRRALNKLQEKRWINIKSCGRNGLKLTQRRKNIPRYLEQSIVDNFQLYIEIEIKSA